MRFLRLCHTNQQVLKKQICVTDTQRRLMSSSRKSPREVPHGADDSRWTLSSSARGQRRQALGEDLRVDPSRSFDLYTMWRNVEAAPTWQEQITQVVSNRRTNFSLGHGVDGKTIEWDSEVLADEPGKRIAWQSIGGDSDNAGEVIFEEAPGDRGTMVTVLQEFRMGKLASAWETLRRTQPKTSGD